MLNGKYIDNNGTEYWRKDGKPHRDNGPAIKYTDGTEAWYKNGELHNDNGPAVVYVDGTEAWCRNGARLTKTEILIIKEKIEFDKMMKDMFTN